MPIGAVPAVGGIAAGGVLVGCWNTIKLYFGKITSIFIIRVEVSHQIKDSMSILLVEEFKCSPLGKKQISGHNEYIRPIKRNQLVAFEIIPNEPTIWWRGYRPLQVSVNGNNMNLTFIRGVYSKDKLILEALEKFNEGMTAKDWRSGDRFFIRRKYGSIGESESVHKMTKSVDSLREPEEAMDQHFKLTARPLGWYRDDIGQPKKKSAMGDLSLRKNILDAFQEAVRWRDSEDWFKSRSIPWKRGWMIYGPPGTGKTAFVRALGQELNLPVFLFDISTMTNRDFSDAWNSAMDHSPCIALIEDIDGTFNGRENIACKGLHQGLSFDCLLNTLDGVENTEGVFKIVTTNNIDIVDPALGNPTNGDEMSTRPGRIDRVIEFPILDSDGRRKMADRILGDFDFEVWKDVLERGSNDTGAQFQERCCRIALDLFWEGKNYD